MRIGCHHPWRAPRTARCFNKRRPYVVTLRWWLSLTLSLQELPKWWRFTKNLRFNQQKLEVKHIQIEEVENGHDCIWKLGMVFGNWRSETESCSRKLESYIQMYSETACCIRKLVLGNWHSETRARAFGFKNCIQKLGGEVMDSCNWRFQNPKKPCQSKRGFSQQKLAFLINGVPRKGGWFDPLWK